LRKEEEDYLKATILHDIPILFGLSLPQEMQGENVSSVIYTRPLARHVQCFSPFVAGFKGVSESDQELSNNHPGPGFKMSQCQISFVLYHGRNEMQAVVFMDIIVVACAGVGDFTKRMSHSFAPWSFSFSLFFFHLFS
jgi:hypothetical protein